MERHARIFILGLGVEVLGIGIFVWWADPPAFVPFLFVVAGAGMILYGVSPVLLVGGRAVARIRVGLAPPGGRSVATSPVARPSPPASIKRYGIVWVDAGRGWVGAHCPDHPNVSLLFRETGTFRQVRKLDEDDYAMLEGGRYGRGWLYCSGDENNDPHDVPLEAEKSGLSELFLEMRTAIAAKLREQDRWP